MQNMESHEEKAQLNKGLIALQNGGTTLRVKH